MMQLFVTDYALEGDRVIVREERIMWQVRKVLRMKKGDVFVVQKRLGKGEKRMKRTEAFVRVVVELQEVRKEGLVGRVMKNEAVNIKNESSTIEHELSIMVPAVDEVDVVGGMVTTRAMVTMLVALPNATKKMALIVQKLVEVGVGRIVFWEAERSQLSLVGKGGVDHTTKWQEKLDKVVIESVEQSWRWVVPEVCFVADVGAFGAAYIGEVVVFDTGVRTKTSVTKSKDKRVSIDVCGVIGPEGGFGPVDRAALEQRVDRVVSLGDGLLRMETAAIVGGWGLANALGITPLKSWGLFC